MIQSALPPAFGAGYLTARALEFYFPCVRALAVLLVGAIASSAARDAWTVLDRVALGDVNDVCRHCAQCAAVRAGSTRGDGDDKLARVRIKGGVFEWRRAWERGRKKGGERDRERSSQTGISLLKLLNVFILTSYTLAVY